LAIPTLYGAETQKPPRSESPTGEAFFEQAASSAAPEVVSAIRALYEFSKQADELNWGRGATGSFNPRFYAVRDRSMYSVYSDGRLILNFFWICKTPSGRAASEIIGNELGRMGFPLPSNFRERFLRIDPDWWAPRVDDLVKAFERALGAARATANTE
jgi:hypothetical protein